MPRFKPDTFALTALLGLLTAIGPLSTDMYLPSLPAIQTHFAATSGEVQWTLSFYLVGFAIGQVFYGPISDRTSRKGPMLAGLALYGLGSLAAALAPSLPMLILARLLQGIGGAGPLVLARAVVRDLYDGRRAGQELARMGTIMGLVPAVAPVLGAGLELAFGWRANFVGAFLLVAALSVLVAWRLPETLAQKLASPFSLTAIAGGFGNLLADGRFRPFAALSAMTYAGLFAFISGSSFVLQGHFGLDPGGFALAFALVVIGYILGTLAAQRVVTRKGSLTAIRVGTALQAIGGVCMLGCGLLLPNAVAGLVVPMALYTFGVGFTLPQSAAGALMPFPERAGSVSSLLGILQMGFAALIGAGVGAGISATPFALTGVTAFFGLAGLAMVPAVRRVSPFS